jgi:hypothetical protein
MERSKIKPMAATNAKRLATGAKQQPPRLGSGECRAQDGFNVPAHLAALPGKKSSSTESVSGLRSPSRSTRSTGLRLCGGQAVLRARRSEPGGPTSNSFYLAE